MRLKRYLHLYKKFASQHLKSLMQSKVDFFLGLIGFFLMQAGGVAFLYLVFQQIPDLNGWTFNELLFIYGFAQLPRGLDHLIADMIWRVANPMIVNGDFDRYLVRPINPLFQVIATRFQVDAFGELIVGLGLVIMALFRMEVRLTLMYFILFPLLVVSGTVIYTSIKLFCASLAFWMKNSFPILHLVYSLSDYAKYPLGIYINPIRLILSFIIPFAFAAFIPASYLIGKESLLIGVGGTVVFAALSFSIAYRVWSKGISIYESAGS
ncbi:ABC transporter permease [Halonatronum saccharophilum]|uniref:ABC transporter permease n=1 Tax=Halonatronum saccharophilum TaxID=150060 RepID=UPI0004B51B24|nr:ABC-2 family transporter protein [Halonatronum saccharophilum]